MMTRTYMRARYVIKAAMVTTMVAATIRAPSLSSGFEGRGGGGPGGADMLAGLDCRNRVRDWPKKKSSISICQWMGMGMLEEPRAQRNNKPPREGLG